MTDTQCIEQALVDVQRIAESLVVAGRQRIKTTIDLQIDLIEQLVEYPRLTLTPLRHSRDKLGGHALNTAKRDHEL